MVSMTDFDGDDVPVSGSDAVARLQAAGALDDLMGQIDSGSVQLDGPDGLVQELIKIELRRCLTVHLADLWLKRARAYRLVFAGPIGANPDQRVPQREEQP